MSDVRLLTVTIRCPVEEAYAFLSEPRHFARWASGLGGSLRHVDGQWHAESPTGPVTIRFTPENPYGVLDHWVTAAGGKVIHVPLRIVPHGDGSELTLTLFRDPDIDEGRYDADAAWVLRDLNAAKALLEKGIR